MKRANWLPAPEFFALNQACAAINRAFDGFGCYLVGSSLERRDYRDVDVRYIMGDVEFDAMFGRGGDARDAYWSLLCLTISVWLRETTGLPVDFQIQRQTDCNAEFDGARSALGHFHDYPGKRPSDLNGGAA